MFAKYIQARPAKKITHNNKVFSFPRGEWVLVSDPTLFLRLKDYPELFEISDFDIKPFLGFGNKVSFESKNGFVLLRCSDKQLFFVLDKMPFLIKQADLENGIRIYRVTNCLHPQYLDWINNYKVVNSDYNIGVFRDCPGWGDVQMVLSVIEHLKNKFVGSKITFSCPEHLLPLAQNNPHIDNLVNLNKFYKTDFDIVFNLSQIAVKYEINKGADTDRNRIELFAEACKLDNYLPAKIWLTNKEKEWAKKFLKKYSGRKKIALFIKSFTITRNWDKFEQLSEELEKRYGDKISVIIFDNGQDNYGNKLVWNGVGDTFFNLSIRQVLSALNECDLVIGPDTGPMHSAASLDIPTIWLFSHINGSVRTKGYKYANIIQKDKEVCNKLPCWYNVDCGAQNFIPDCSKAIQVDDVIEVVNKVLFNNKKKISKVKNKKKVNKVLFRQPATAGDILLTTGTIEGLNRKFSDCIIDYMTYDNYKDILINNPYIDNIIPWNNDVSDYKFVFEPHAAIVNAAWSSGNLHLRELYNKVCEVEDFPIYISSKKYKIPFKKYIVIHSTSLKQKTYRYFDKIVNKFKLPVIQIGGFGDFFVEGITLDLRGKTSYRETAYILKNAEFLLGIDSFPAHCSSAVGTPSIVLFGMTCSRVCKPQFLSTIIEPDYIKVCPSLAPCHNSVMNCNPLCIDTIEPEKVLNVINEKFSKVLK